MRQSFSWVAGILGVLILAFGLLLLDARGNLCENGNSNCGGLVPIAVTISVVGALLIGAGLLATRRR